MRKNAIQGSDYSAVLATMLLAIVTMVNVFISAMPSSVTEYDISTGKLYSVTSNIKRAETESRKKSGGDAAILLCAGVTKEMREQILGLAVNLEIDLTDYDIDYGAQEYRLIAYVDGQQISAEFTFEDVFAQKMEEQEASEASGQ